MKETGNIEDLRGYGCSDGYCVVFQPQGMHTNRGCHCFRDPMKIQKALMLYRQEVIALRSRGLTEGRPGPNGNNAGSNPVESAKK